MSAWSGDSSHRGQSISGAFCSFLITSGELQAAAADLHFLPFAVANALDAHHRKIWQFTGKQFSKHFNLQPVTFVAKARGITS